MIIAIDVRHMWNGRSIPTMPSSWRSWLLVKWSGSDQEDAHSLSAESAPLDPSVHHPAGGTSTQAGAHPTGKVPLLPPPFT